ncbi:GerMN domain-containing protein [Paenibacillus pini]|uniref:OrfW protein n=1 Tax=Paenibacillus pini JCM 16418 TaxID=1236976 RepID=W7YNF3_9BACL|nr:GerMN domain-containing protein [Paenibacillus pini]GAF09133.1 OrfW protein [Paenibacillus pini JCM 16418]
MNKKIWCAALLSMVVVVGTGCGQKPDTSAEPAPTEQGSTSNTPDDSTNTANAAGSEQPSNTVNTTNNGTTTTTVETSTTEKKQKIDVYYTDPQELELKKSQQEIKFSDDIHKYKEAYKALQNSLDKELIPLWSKIELKSLDIKNGALTMDIHMPDEARLGSGGEQYALDALSNTMFQFDEVKSLELLVDGKKVESLMGHVDLEHPMVRR